MKKLFAVLLVLFAATLSFAQGQVHKLTMDRGFFTTDYTIDGQEVDSDAFERELTNVPEAISKWNTGNTMRYISWGAAFGGGFLLGYGIAEGSGYQAPESYKMKVLAGGVIIVAALIVEHIGNCKKDTAVDIYNKEIGKNAGNGSTNWSLVPTEQGGIALAFNF
ncbi:hypothetical protein [Fibrobacter sp. UWB12]|uniref:hypothetical protein n=1 Tax=Fibrobacter sp. UWB12 TaxID=1896203 RepID=UPI0009141C3C|nr:hypothetical protein [Fibrobacter sp. UWB12]SHK95543.1 hypothetical protein SAMN05720759_11044 [Fibrobacter sp. UWB12]